MYRAVFLIILGGGGSAQSEELRKEVTAKLLELGYLPAGLEGPENYVRLRSKGGVGSAHVSAPPLAPSSRASLLLPVELWMQRPSCACQ